MFYKQRGNVLFIILLGVVLLAALTFAVRSSLSGGGKSGSSEKRSAQASEILNFGVSVKTAMQRLLLTDGFENWQLDYSDTNSASLANTNCTSDDCRLFKFDGGQIKSKRLSRDMLAPAGGCSYVDDNTWSGQFWLRGATVSGVGEENDREQLIQYPGVNRDLCIEFNKLNGVTNPNGLPPADTAGSCAVNTYSGAMSSAPVITTNCVSYGDEAPEIVGKQNFCVLATTGCYHIFMTLQEN